MGFRLNQKNKKDQHFLSSLKINIKKQILESDKIVAQIRTAMREIPDKDAGPETWTEFAFYRAGYPEPIVKGQYLKTRPMGQRTVRRMIMQWSNPHPVGIKICQIPENQKVGPVMEIRVCTMEVIRNDFYSKKPMIDAYTNEVVTIQKLTVQAKTTRVHMDNCVPR